MLKMLFFIALLFMYSNARAQHHLLKGSWVTPAQEHLLIIDTTSSTYYNYFTNSELHEDHGRLYIIGDTLSFLKTYTRYSNKITTAHKDRYDLKIITLTDSLLVVSPVSTFSKKFFLNQDTLYFQRQDYTIDNTFRFEKIIFHTTRCYGSCDVYHLEVDRSRSFKLHKAFMYNQETYLEDSIAEGYFTGELPDSLFQPLLHALLTTNLRNLKMDSQLCCDGSLKTMIVYFNGQRKYFKTMFTPRMTDRLLIALYRICRNSNGKRTNEKFKLEE